MSRRAAPLRPGASWLIHQNRDVASARLQGYLVHEYLQSSGMYSRILFAPPVPIPLPWSEAFVDYVVNTVDTPVVLLQKIQEDDRSRQLVDGLRRRGIATVYIQCDYQPKRQIALRCDHVVVPSAFLHDYYRGLGAPCTLVPDPVEQEIDAAALRRRFAERGEEGPLTLVWVGQASGWPSLAPLQRLLEKPPWSEQFALVTISSHEDADIRWQLDRVAADIGRFDVGVIPTDSGDGALAKSANRVLLFMALGLPVIAGDIPAYREVIRHRENGLLAADEAGWMAALEDIRDAALRRRLAGNAHADTVPGYRLDAVGQQWRGLIESLGQGVVGRPSRPGIALSLRFARIACETRIGYARGAMHYRRLAAAARALGGATARLPLAPAALGSWLALLGEWVGKLVPGARKRGRRRHAGDGGAP